MRRSLPPEILDLVVNDLHDEPTTLRSCCIVKSWILRARKHLFARIEFHAKKSHVERWKKTFPDPSNSPAHHTRSLSILGLTVVTTADTDLGGWIRTFRKVTHLRLECLSWEDRQASLIPFHGLSPDIRSLRMTSTVFEVFDLVCSFPLLEDLALFLLVARGSSTKWAPPLTSPKLTGSLDVGAMGGIHFAIPRLLDLPGGLRFEKITLQCLNGDFESTTELVSRCSDTLESLTVRYYNLGVSPSVSVIDCTSPPLVDAGTVEATPLGLSAATKLKDSVFQSPWESVQWIIRALQTVKSKNLRSITLRPSSAASVNTTVERVRREWQELDHLLVQCWTSHSIRPRIMYQPVEGRKDMRDYSPSLLPELTRRGLVDLVEAPASP